MIKISDNYRYVLKKKIFTSLSVHVFHFAITLATGTYDFHINAQF